MEIKTQMKKLFLSSSFGDVVDIFKSYLTDDVKGKTVTFIPTASLVEEVTFYVDEARNAFREMEVVIDELDISTASEEVISGKIKKNDFIYVSGGNTFFLLQELKRTGADKLIVEEINSGKLYVGESAGAIIVSSNIEYVEDMDDPKAATELMSYQSLGVIDFYPVPHYGEFPFEEAAEQVVTKYNSELKLCPISNSQVILVDGGNVKVVGLN